MNHSLFNMICAIASKISVTPRPRGVYFPTSKLHSISAVANLLAHNNIANSDLLLRSNFITECCSFSDNLTSLRVTYILLMMIHDTSDLFKM